MSEPENPFLKFLKTEDDLATQFLISASSGELEKLKELYENNKNKIDINAVAKTDMFADEETPLSAAAKNGHTEIVKFLLNLKDANGKLLVDIEKSSEAALTENTPYEISIENGKYEIAQLLEQAGANTKISDEKFKKGFESSVLYNNEFLLNYILKKWGVDKFKEAIDSKIDFHRLGSDHETTALIFACSANHEKLVDTLLKNGANPNIQDKNNRTALYYAFEAKNMNIINSLINFNININTLDDENNDPLMWAIQTKNLEALKLMLDKKLNLNTRNKFGKTTLIAAIEAGDLEIINFILTQKESNDLINIIDNGKNSPLLLCLEKGYIETANLLLARGANPFIKNNLGVSPFMKAAELGNLDLIKQMLQHKDAKNELDAVNNSGETALYRAITKGHISVAKTIASPFPSIIPPVIANPHLQNNDGYTALGAAVEKGDLELVKLLLSHPDTKKLIDLGNKKFDATALMGAIIVGHTEIAEELIANGANIFKMDYSGVDSLTLAKSSGLEKIIEKYKGTQGKYTLEEEMFIENNTAIKRYGHALGLGAPHSTATEIGITNPKTKETVFIKTDGWFSLPAAKTLNNFIEEYSSDLAENSEEKEDFKIIKEAYQNNENYLEYDQSMTNTKLYNIYHGLSGQVDAPVKKNRLYFHRDGNNMIWGSF